MLIVYIVSKFFCCLCKHYTRAEWGGNAGQNSLEFYNTLLKSMGKWESHEESLLLILVRWYEWNICSSKGISSSIRPIYLLSSVSSFIFFEPAEGLVFANKNMTNGRIKLRSQIIYSILNCKLSTLWTQSYVII